jgi:hypothetical protein
MRIDMDLSLSTLLQVAALGAAIVAAYAASAARDDAQDKALASLENALIRERDERIAATARADRLLADSVATRALWAVGGGRRRDRQSGD